MPRVLLPLLALVPQLLASAPALANLPAWSVNPEREKAIYALLRELTLEEKVHLLHGTAKMYSGGVERLGIAEIAYTDGPLGVREELERDSWAPAGWTNDFATYFPSSSALAATWNPELSKRYGHAIGAEARARGKDILLAPAINLIRSPLCGRTYEYFSEEPALIEALVAPYVQGVQAEDVAACVKHYAVNNQETNRGTINALADERALRELYLPGFRAAVVEGEAYSVMGAYNRFRGDYVCENEYLLQTILKGEWNFPGVVVSDWDATHSTIASALNGLDLEMGTEKPSYAEFHFADALLEAVQSGALSEAVVDGIVLRILRVLHEVGRFDAQRKTGALNTPEHRDTVRAVAEEAIVLLQNDAGLLPLDRKSIRRIAVIGDNATRKHALGGFGAGVKAAYEITPLEGIRALVGDSIEVTHARGYRDSYLESSDASHDWGRPIDYTADPALVAEAVALAQAADVVIFVGGTNRSVESESSDRTTLRLPFAQEAVLDAILEVNPQTVVTLTSGAPVDLNHIVEVAPALVWAWFNGSESGTALAKVLFGEVNPSGKLPFTIPVALEDLGPHALDAFPGTPEKVVYEEGILVGYRWLDAHGVEPRFPFGFGLSYTEFALSEFAIERSTIDPDGSVHATVTLTNTGTRSGKETVQLYVSKPDAEMPQAPKQLLGFEKCELAPGQSTIVSFEFPAAELASYDVNSRSWRVLPGSYTLSVGQSSRELSGSATFEVAP